MFPPEVAATLARFALPANTAVERKQSGGGLSGSRLWKLSADERAWCLRCYGAEHPTAERLAAIHAAVSAASAAGIAFLAPPIADRSGATVIRAQDRLWDLSPWLPGEAVLTAPSAEQTRQAFTALARLHLAWQDLRQPELAVAVEGSQTLGPPPGLNGRLRFLTDLQQGGLQQIDRGLARFRSEPWFLIARQIVAQFSRATAHGVPLLQAAAREMVPRQVCLRDARPEHFLFVGEELSGVIDYDAVRVDSPTADLARLSGAWKVLPSCLDAYTALRPLTDAERYVLQAYVDSAELLAGMQWLWWLVIDQRTFDAASLTARLRAMLPR